MVDSQFEAIEMREVSIDSLLASNTQTRERLREEAVEEYAEAMRRGVVLPPPVVFMNADGVELLSDGFHRVQAHAHLGHKVVLCEIRRGTRLDALTHGIACNSQHKAERLTREDKRYATRLLLLEAPTFTDRRIGEIVDMDGKTVRRIRQEMENQGEIDSQSVRVGKDGRVRRVVANEDDGVTTPHQGLIFPEPGTKAVGFVSDCDISFWIHSTEPVISRSGQQLHYYFLSLLDFRNEELDCRFIGRGINPEWVSDFVLEWAQEFGLKREDIDWVIAESPTIKHSYHPWDTQDRWWCGPVPEALRHPDFSYPPDFPEHEQLDPELAWAEAFSSIGKSPEQYLQFYDFEEDSLGSNQEEQLAKVKELIANTVRLWNLSISDEDRRSLGDCHICHKADGLLRGQGICWKHRSIWGGSREQKEATTGSDLVDQLLVEAFFTRVPKEYSPS